MKPFGVLEPTLIFVEIRPASLHAWTGLAGVDLPLERGPDGRLTGAATAAATAALQTLVPAKGWMSRARVCCAIGSRGVLLRPIVLPVTAPAEVPRLLQLKIEGEFPLPPDALAWGWSPLLAPAPSDATSPRQGVLVAAVKKEVIEEYAAIIGPIDPDPIFAVAALVRPALVPIDQRAFAVLDVGPTQSELTLLDAAFPPTVQLLPWGENRLLERLGATLSQSREEVLAAIASFQSHTHPARNDALESALDEAVRPLISSLPAAA